MALLYTPGGKARSTFTSGDAVAVAPRERKYTIISVDDHLVEPPDVFEGRLPARLQSRAPHVVELGDGTEVWECEGELLAHSGASAVVGRPQSEWAREALRYDEMRRGCWDIDARVADMDINGVSASICFPSSLVGFCGRKTAELKDEDLGLAVMRAWNDWHIDAWAGPYPDRIIPVQITWLKDPQIAAEEIYRNAARGFKAVSFCEDPAKLGYGSLFTEYWDPFIRACEETETVICLHVGSSGWSPELSEGAPAQMFTVQFPTMSLVSATQWLWSGLPARYPNLKLAMSEGGLGWVVMLAERSDFVLHHSVAGADRSAWKGDLLPSEILRRNFWFCSTEDRAMFELRDVIGVDRITVESDYPHADGTWPDTQTAIEGCISGLDPEEVEMVTWKNAAKLFRHDLATS
jgi:predicted TIM-barrel fold metal-dependent hydrolase